MNIFNNTQEKQNSIGSSTHASGNQRAQKTTKKSEEGNSSNGNPNFILSRSFDLDEYSLENEVIDFLY
jgi:hypothetical protein